MTKSEIKNALHKTGHVSTEQLKHIRCGCDDNRWFSIGDPGASGEIRDHLYCPWCGDKLTTSGVITQSDVDLWKNSNG